MPSIKAIKRELQKRIASESIGPDAFSIERFCFDKQIAFINDPAKFKTAVCSRRAGKSVSCAADLLITALQNPKSTCAYITLSRITAKRIIWRQLLDINKEFQLGAKEDKTELSLTLPNGAVIYITGAKDESEIEKLRGLALKKVYIDEAQSFRPYIQKLVDDVIVPALYDYDGSLCLIGTPGPVPAGYFYDSSHSPTWSHHKWTILDNPHIKIKSGKNPEDILASERARRGITEDDPTYRRESLGEWVQDTNALVLHFSKSKNIYRELPDLRMQYVIGVDIGWVDADAIAVLGYSFGEPSVYLVEEHVKGKQTITELVNKLKFFQEKYNPVKIVMDAGALGKKIQEEIKQRHSMHVEAAEKHRKFEFLELLNDDLRTGRFKARPGTQFEEDSYLVQWDRSNPDKLKVSDSYHSDIADAVLYAWRECKHFIQHSAPVNIKRNTAAYMDMLETKEAEQVERTSQAEGEALWDEWEYNDMILDDLEGSDEF